MEPLGPCTYVTRDWNVHDIRWATALADLGFDVTTLSLHRDNLNEGTLREALAPGTGAILAGPLDSVAHLLVSTGFTETHYPSPVIGLSWGFDLIEMQQQGADLTWLSDLSGLIVDSVETARIAESVGVETSRITLIPWGVDLDTFSPLGPRSTPEDFNLPREAQLIVTLRAHEPRYRNADVIDAFTSVAQHDASCALLIGHSGSQTSELEDLVTERGLTDRVRFLGTLAEADLPPLLRAAVVYVTASEVDGTSVTLLQAMACGTPVVASDTAGNRAWVVPQETGRLFRTGDPKTLAEALAEALDPSTAADTTRMATRARMLVEENADWSANRSRLLGALALRP
jgi:glycosyltransferase involved in cell wall biosynthesis